jgi:hypothetical protein
LDDGGWVLDVGGGMMDVGGWRLEGLAGGGMVWEIGGWRWQGVGGGRGRWFESHQLTCVFSCSFLFVHFSVSHVFMFHISYSQKYIRNEQCEFHQEDV